MYSTPRATWTVMRLIWMQIALCTAIILEGAIFGKHSLARVFELTFNNIFQRGEVWQLVTTTLVHANPFQLLFNALTLWMFGSELEQRWGRSVFFRFYLSCALGSSLAFIALSAAFPMRNEAFTTSTGVNLGLLIAYAIYWPDRQIWFFFLFPLRMKFVALITGLIAIMYAVTSAPFALTAAGHVGGLITAGLILLLSGGEPARLDRPFQRLAEMFRRFGSRPTTKGRASSQTATGENIESRIDAILDKISRGGMKSLSNEEKQFLRDASDRMNQTKH